MAARPALPGVGRKANTGCVILKHSSFDVNISDWESSLPL